MKQSTRIMELKKLYHVLSTNIKYNKQVDYFINNGMNFDSVYSSSRNNIKDPQPVVNVRLRLFKKSRSTKVSRLTFLWGSGASGGMIKINNASQYAV